MNRVIKFRGKCVEDSKYAGEWVVGGCSMPDEDVDSKKYGNEWLITVYLGGNCSCSYHVIPETVGQFTGFCDEKGNEIYEGDILLLEGAKTNIIKRVDFDTEKGTWKAVAVNTVQSHDLYEWLKTSEVIGNIHDNPELLKGELNND